MNTVTLYSPEGNPEVWPEESVPVKIAEGYRTCEMMQPILDAEAASRKAAWLASPDTLEERFLMLRMARDNRIAETDYMLMPDYPLDESRRAPLETYRQTLRDLPAQPGSPWDGGGDGTPWPPLPAV